MPEEEKNKYGAFAPSEIIPPFQKWAVSRKIDAEDLLKYVLLFCHKLIKEMHLDHKAFETTYPEVDLKKGENRYCLLEVKKSCCDMQGNETLERFLNVRLLTGYNLSGKAGGHHQPNCSPTLIVNVHAAFMESGFRAWVFHQFDKFVYKYDVTLNFSVESPEAWRYPTKKMEAKGHYCEKVIDCKYPYAPIGIREQ